MPAYCMTSAHSPQAKPWKTAAYLIKLQVADCSRQLLFCRRLRMPTLRHDSSAAINPVETVTPPNLPPQRPRPVAGNPGGCEPDQLALAAYFHSTPIPNLLESRLGRLAADFNPRTGLVPMSAEKKTARTFLLVPGGQ